MSLPADTLFCDTLVYDAGEIARWQSDPAYDYNRELITPEVDFWALFSTWFGKVMAKIFGSRFAEQYSEILLIALFAILLLSALWVLYKKRPELFMISRKRVAYAVQEDTIYGVDFHQEIETAMGHKNYREVIRLLYLQTLRILSDAGQINWQLYKTPTEYIYELKGEERKEPFREFTNCFLRVRYGNFEATEQIVAKMKKWQDCVVGGDKIEVKDWHEKGGEHEG